MNEAVLSHPTLQTLLVLWVAVLLDALWRWPAASHPLTLLRYLAEKLAQKVLPAHGEPARQHLISGSLAAAILTLPAAGLLSFLLGIAEYPWFFEAVLLFALLDFGPVRWRYQQVLLALGQNKKVLARNQVSQLVMRDCEPLSEIGVAKAAMESLILRFCFQYSSVLLWYVIVGPIGALMYRMLLTLSWQWNRRRSGFAGFATPSRSLARLMGGIPVVITAVIMMMVTHPVHALRALRQSLPSDGTARLLALFGGGQGIQLGGPVMYAGKKIRYPRVGGQREVRYSDLSYTRRAVWRAAVLLIALISLALLAKWQLTPHLVQVIE
ncbi:adenosylcobinamide-phosphate synthase [Alteromonas aestuariivivens]|uniref:Adenosylcobinamide-phosphate synthase n=1 Tax=Alteromonas aestuariivivens TaxID=1938339 RepID=A0A3D8ME17_9ALTE|nr:cobalamin biosynthesis protein [Alteromonas aestuariivivens]RDV28982.1 adenosylcobinamide-phosphate synthase [Alteromonas aestuariivivens]